MNIAKSSLIFLLGGLSSLAGQVPDPTASIREVLDKRFPTQLLQDRPALAIGYFIFAAHEMNGNLSAVDLNLTSNLIQGKLGDGQTVTWACNPMRLRNNGLGGSAAKLDINRLISGIRSYDAECTLSESETEPAKFFVVVEQAGTRTAVRAKAGAPPENGPAMFIGTTFPKIVPSWVPVIAPEYVESIQQASFLPNVPESNNPQVRAFSFGRYVFDSTYSFDALMQYMDKNFQSHGFNRGMNLGDDAIGVKSMADGLLRLARFGVTKLPNGKSRCDLLFMQTKR